MHIHDGKQFTFFHRYGNSMQQANSSLAQSTMELFDRFWVNGIKHGLILFQNWGFFLIV